MWPPPQPRCGCRGCAAPADSIAARLSTESAQVKGESDDIQNPESQRPLPGSAPGLSSLALRSNRRTALAHDCAPDNQVLEWNQVFIDTLIATNTPNSSSQRLGAIVHTAIFDAYNGVERRYQPILVRPRAAPGASRRAAVIAAAYTALVGLFPSRQLELDSSYAASLAALGEDSEDCSVSRDHDTAWHSRERANAWQSRQRGIAWGTEVAQAVLARRATDGFSGTYVAFSGGLAVGQWRPVAPAAAMSAQGLAFTAPFVLVANTQFRPPAPRALDSADVCRRLQRGQGAWSQDRLDPHRGADGARSFLGRQRKRSLESGSKPDCARPPPFDLQHQPPARGVEHRDGRYGFDHLERQALLWRRCGAGDMAADYRHHAGRYRWQSRTRFPTSTGCLSSLHRPTRNILPDIPVSTGRPRAFFSLTSATDKHLRSRHPDSRTARTPASGRRAPTVTTRECGAACTIRARSQSAMQLAERSRAT